MPPAPVPGPSKWGANAVANLANAAEETEAEEFWDNFQKIGNEVEAQRTFRMRAPGTQKGVTTAMILLKSFLSKYLKKEGSALKVDDILKDGGDVSLINRRFWKLYIHFMATQKNSFTKQPLAITTVRERVISALFEFGRITGVVVDSPTQKETLAELDQIKERYKLRDSQIKLTAQLPDLVTLIKHGIMNETAVHRHPRERLNLLVAIQLIAYTAARPSEVFVSDQYRDDNDALKGKDLRIFACAMDKKLIFKILVTFRLLKGMRNDTSKYRTSVLYSDETVAPGLDLTVSLLTLLLEDNAFVDIQSYDQLFGLSVKAIETQPNGEVELLLRPDYQETCILRSSELVNGEWIVSSTKGLSYQQANRMRYIAALYAGLKRHQ
ncbi:hypothetical protein CF326_g9633 [Tilletia indica]|nr:hypothetical protein CF326_g9633 [Tilletia indica]